MGGPAGDLLRKQLVQVLLLPEDDRTIITVQLVTRANSTTHDLLSVTPSENEEVNANTQRMISLGNQDEKELYSVRCRYIFNSYDTRKGHANGGKIVYQGPLNFQNTIHIAFLMTLHH